MKLLWMLLFACSIAMTANATEVSRGVGFTVNINKDASLSMSVLVKSTKESSLSDIKGCPPSKGPRALRCLLFHTSAGISEVPLVLVDLIDEDELASDASKLFKGAPVHKESKESFAWGSVLSFKVDSAHVFYLIPEDRTYSVRLGPLPEGLLANHDFQFAKVSWKFKD